MKPEPILKILYVTALPKRDLQPNSSIDNDEEFRRLRNQIKDSGQEDLVELIPAFAAQATDIARELREKRPHIVHFSTHGDRTDHSLILNDGNGGVAPLLPEQLVTLLRPVASTLRCVILNACWSEAAAMQLQALQPAPYRVGTKGTLKDATALAFAFGFYQALLGGESLRNSFTAGLTNIRITNVPAGTIPEEFPKEDTQVGSRVLLPRKEKFDFAKLLLQEKLPTRSSMYQFLNQIFRSVVEINAFCKEDFEAVGIHTLDPSISREERIEQLLRKQYTSTILLRLLHRIDSDQDLRHQFVIHHAILHYVSHKEYEAELTATARDERKARLLETGRRWLTRIGAALSVLMIAGFALTHHFDRPRELPPDDQQSERYKEIYSKRLLHWAGLKRSELNRVTVQTAYIHGSAAERKIYFDLRVEWKKRENHPIFSDDTWIRRTYQGAIHYEGTYSELKDGMPVRLEIRQTHFSFLPISPGVAHFLGFIDLFWMTRQHDNDLQENLMECLLTPLGTPCKV